MVDWREFDVQELSIVVLLGRKRVEDPAETRMMLKGQLAAVELVR
jgi:hypothetical protein